MIRIALFAPALLLLSNCSSASPVLAGDAARNAAVPVAARPVWVGRNANRRASACARRVRLRSENVAVRWSPAAAGPPKSSISGEVLACDSEGAWTGIVFGAAGESLDYCNLNRRIGGPTEYQGPCRSGWVRNADLAI